MGTTNWIAAAIAMSAGAGGFLGYRAGAYELASVTATLTSTRHELDEQARQYQRAKLSLANGADTIAAAHQQDLAQLQARHLQDEQRLKAANADAKRRIDSLVADIGAIDRERAALRGAPRVANEAASVARRLADLDAAQAAASAERDGLACLAAAVPSTQLVALRGD